MSATNSSQRHQPYTDCFSKSEIFLTVDKRFSFIILNSRVKPWECNHFLRVSSFVWSQKISITSKNYPEWPKISSFRVSGNRRGSWYSPILLFIKKGPRMPIFDVKLLIFKRMSKIAQLMHHKSYIHVLIMNMRHINKWTYCFICQKVKALLSHFSPCDIYKLGTNSEKLFLTKYF